MSKRKETRDQIVKQSQKASKRFEKTLMRFTRAISAGIDNLLFTRRWTFLISLLITIIFFLWVRSSSNLAMNIRSSFTDEAVVVRLVASQEIYEINGIPKTTQAMISGSMVDVTTTRNQKDYHVIADLTGLDAGVHTVKLKAEGFSPNVNVFLNPSDVRVTIREKTSQNFLLNYEFINTNRLDPQYVLATPVFERNEVTVRASQVSLNEIASVKALIDVSDKVESFNTQAKVVAYNQQGQQMDIDIIPNTVNVNVDISSPSKKVPLVVKLVGTIPQFKAIDTLELDHSEVTLYGPEQVLLGINQIELPINAESLNADGSFIHTINLPNGVRKADINRVEINYTLGDRITTVVENMVVFVENNPQGHQVVLKDLDKLLANIEVTGTQNQVESMELGKVRVFIDIEKKEKGVYSIPIQVSSVYPFLDIKPVTPEIEVEIK